MSHSSEQETLQQCLEMLESGHSIEQCLAQYPQMENRLRPLLMLAQSTQQAAQAILPSTQIRDDTYNLALETWTKSSMENPRSFLVFLRPLARPILVLVLVLASLGAGGWGTTHAASQSVPGDALHPVKLAKEQFLLSVTPDRFSKAKFLRRLTEERFDEMHQLVIRGRNGQYLDRTMDRLSVQTEEMVKLLGGEMPKAPIARQINPKMRINPKTSQRTFQIPKEIQEIKRLLTAQFYSQRALNQGAFGQIPNAKKTSFNKAFQHSQLALYSAIHAIDQLEQQN